MGRILLIGRLAARDPRRHPVQAGPMLLAIMATSATLTLGLVLHGVTGIGRPAVPVTLLAVAALTAIPARIGGRRPPAEILQSELA